MLSLLLFFLVAIGGQAQATSDDEKSLAELRKASQEAKELEKWFYDSLRTHAKDNDKVQQLNSEYHSKTKVLGERYRPLIFKYAKDTAAFDAIVALNGMIPLDDQILDIIRQHHISNPGMVKLLNTLSQNGGAQQELINEVALKHPDKKVRAEVLFGLARMDRIYLLDSVKPQPSFGGRLGTPEVLRKRATERLNRVIADYADLKNEEGVSYLDLAQDQLAGVNNVGRLVVGKPAIDVQGIDLEGKPLKLTAGNGTVSMLVFWGTWCGPCMRLVPREVALAEKYQGQPFKIYGVNGGDEQKKALESAKAKKMTWPSFFIGPNGDGLGAVWGVSAWPTVFVIDHQGIIRYIGHGDGMEKAVAECMENAKGGK